jgi:C_GCAxxG_C_C family probable redox protein
MKSKVNEAEACFGRGFNCCQAVLSSYGEELGLDEREALKIASGFGAGIAYMGDICGAVTGAFMVIGLKYGRFEAEDNAAKDKTYKLIREFVRLFKEKNGSIKCNELLDTDVNTEEGLKKAYEADKFSTVCPKMVRDAAEIAGRLLNE